MGDDPVFADLHESRGSPEHTLETIIEWAGNAVGATDAGIFLLSGKGQVETAAPTSSRVIDAHDRQVELGEGPSVAILNETDVSTYIVIGDTATDQRFPTWGPEAATLGLRSVISVVLETAQKRFGSLNVYSDQAEAFDREDLAVIDIFSRRAAMAIAVAEDAAGLTTALDTRKLIGQAQGILMERFDIDGDRAFEYLVRQSQDKNLKLRAIADWIVANRRGGNLDTLTP